MMIHPDFMLETDKARELYHDFAEAAAHHRLSLPPAARGHRRGPPLREPDPDLARRRPLQVAGDAGRGRRRALLTGRRPDWEKFEKWAETVPQTLRNPLYHWTHLELEAAVRHRDRLLGPLTGQGDLGRGNAMLARAGILRPRHHAADERRRRLHDRRSGRRPAASRGDLRDRRGLSRPGPARRSGPTRPWPSRSPEALQRLGRTALRAPPAWTSGRSLASWRRSAAGTTSFTPWAAGSRTTAWRRSTPRTTRSPRSATTFDASAPDKPVAPTRSPSSSRPCSTSSPSWTARRAGRSSSTSAPCATTTRGCSRALGPDTGFDSIGDFEMARPLARFLDRLDRGGPAGQDDPLQPQPARQRAAGHHDRQLPGRPHARARCSSAAAGGSSTRRTA